MIYGPLTGMKKIRTGNTLDCDQSLMYTPRALFSRLFLKVFFVLPLYI